MDKQKGLNILITCIMTFLFFCENAHSAWSNNPSVNNAISTAIEDQGDPKITTDGSGGAIVAWYDIRGGTHRIYAQRINAQGEIQWTVDGVAISTGENDNNVSWEKGIKIMSDGSGGAIITWAESSMYDTIDTFDIFAQRIDANGVLQWTESGVTVCEATNFQLKPAIISDGSGGAIITWYDRRSGSDDIYAQRISANGQIQWTANGVAICTAINRQIYPAMTTDGSGGAIITWMDERSLNGWDIYAQRISSVGSVLWTEDGVAISTAASMQREPSITIDGNNGAIISWQDNRNGNFDIYCQRINAQGEIQWTADGVAICTAAYGQNYCIIVSDGSGGAIITWVDTRSGDYMYDIYAQRINANGVIQWTPDGVAICVETHGQGYPAISYDVSSGAIITWYDERGIGGSDIYAQRINTQGEIQWTVDGVAISTATYGQVYPQVISDGNGGAIIAWEDTRNYIGIHSTDIDIYAQLIDANGIVGGWNYPGDINHDEEVDIIDAILSLQIVTGIAPSQNIFKDVDSNGDKKIGIEETVYILRKTGQ